MPELEEPVIEWITARELALLLRVPESTIRYWEHQGTGPRSAKFGRHRRWSMTDVKEWIERNRSGGAA